MPHTNGFFTLIHVTFYASFFLTFLFVFLLPISFAIIIFKRFLGKVTLLKTWIFNMDNEEVVLFLPLSVWGDVQDREVVVVVQRSELLTFHVVLPLVGAFQEETLVKGGSIQERKKSYFLCILLSIQRAPCLQKESKNLAKMRPFTKVYNCYLYNRDLKT